jgi:hypothetical protein
MLALGGKEEKIKSRRGAEIFDYLRASAPLRETKFRRLSA